MEITIKLHKAYRDEKRPYRILFTPDPICWTEVPSTFKGLRKQRDGWQRGLWEVLWHYRRMFLNPRYGRVGLVGIPFLWIFEAFAAEVEAFGYFLIVTSAILGILNWPFAILFFVLAILYSVLLSELALGIETLLLDRFGRFRDRMILLASAFIEYMGFREIITIERAFSIFTFRRKRGKRWEAGRGSAPTASEGEPASSAAASSAAGDAPLDES
jgi:cellulose synthase/poly-beta-1,6-N-acetylglucosamine synthase-like glycosyltransferase